MIITKINILGTFITYVQQMMQPVYTIVCYKTNKTHYWGYFRKMRKFKRYVNSFVGGYKFKDALIICEGEMDVYCLVNKESGQECAVAVKAFYRNG